MRRDAVLGLCCWIAVMTVASGSEVVALEWPSRLAAPPPKWDKPLADWMPMFRAALATLPEGTTVVLALSQPALMELPADAATKLQPLLSHRYELMAANPAFAHAPSALAYCFLHRASIPRTCHALHSRSCLVPKPRDRFPARLRRKFFVVPALPRGSVSG
jgi:hypothetical protein